MLDLFEHNRIAYNSACALLAREGRAAVIHPTGTGKSFIAFEYCLSHPEESVCWLAPSEYIFSTQCENLKEVSGCAAPSNITFYTYAKLMLMPEEELSSLQPDLVILDEFHRAGAAKWQTNVLRLISRSPRPKLLGLSATNIRYLDDARDMAEELFDGCIASHITLGDAIVRGILQPPKYVLSVFHYQADLEKYEKRVRSARSKAARDEGEKYLDALRRALANATGVAEVFQKHMAQPHGKYLVFCSNASHMREMISKASEWFGALDAHPHIYSAYSEDPSTSQAFASFKADESDHLRLLYCIDMLNEGIHVKGVSGVILLRPTVSPIIYKQQIGRALSSGAGSNAVIFDIVMNVNNLYSVESLQQEMSAAITYYRYLGQYTTVVNESFHIIDEVQDARRLFDSLEEALSASWPIMFAAAEEYFHSNGHLNVPSRYKTANGLALGRWVSRQRQAYYGKDGLRLTAAQATQLEGIGMQWQNLRLDAFERNFAEAEAFHARYGDLNVPAKYVSPSGFPLGQWLSYMRSARVNQRSSIATPERIARLDALGMVWAAFSDQWERNYLEACAYYEAHGNLLVPAGYVSPSGVKLGNWVSNLRGKRTGKSAGVLTAEQIARLDMIGMAWDADAVRFRIGYEAASAYYAAHGNLLVSVNTFMPDGYNLGLWVQLKRRQYKAGHLTADQIRALESIGMVWALRNRRTK